MSLLVAELVLAALAWKRGWRAAPVLCMTLALASHAGLPLAAWSGAELSGAAGHALAHGIALGALALVCAAPPTALAARVRAWRAGRRAGPLYQI